MKLSSDEMIMASSEESGQLSYNTSSCQAGNGQEQAFQPAPQIGSPVRTSLTSDENLESEPNKPLSN
jgi:hypothetical protein